MSHTPITPSAPGTPLSDRTVGEIVSEHPNLSRVFQAYAIGFCCQGKLTLRDACARHNVAVEEMITALEQELEGADAPLENPANLPLQELTAYIVERHHAFLRRELPRIHAMAERVAHVHGGHTPSLVEIYEVFTEMGQELAEHAQKEEQVLFPLIAQLEDDTANSDLCAPVKRLIQEHAATNASLAKLRELTNGYQPPVDACNTYRALFAGLADLETDTWQHIHLENNILFPRALERAG